MEGVTDWKQAFQLEPDWFISRPIIVNSSVSPTYRYWHVLFYIDGNMTSFKDVGWGLGVGGVHTYPAFLFLVPSRRDSDGHMTCSLNHDKSVMWSTMSTCHQYAFVWPKVTRRNATSLRGYPHQLALYVWREFPRRTSVCGWRLALPDLGHMWHQRSECVWSSQFILNSLFIWCTPSLALRHSGVFFRATTVLDQKSLL